MHLYSRGHFNFGELGAHFGNFLVIVQQLFHNKLFVITSHLKTLIVSHDLMEYIGSDFTFFNHGSPTIGDVNNATESFIPGYVFYACMSGLSTFNIYRRCTKWRSAATYTLDYPKKQKSWNIKNPS